MSYMVALSSVAFPVQQESSIIFFTVVYADLQKFLSYF